MNCLWNANSPLCYSWAKLESILILQDKHNNRIVTDDRGRENLHLRLNPDQYKLPDKFWFSNFMLESSFEVLLLENGAFAEEQSVPEDWNVLPLFSECRCFLYQIFVHFVFCIKTELFVLCRQQKTTVKRQLDSSCWVMSRWVWLTFVSSVRGLPDPNSRTSPIVSEPGTKAGFGFGPG